MSLRAELESGRTLLMDGAMGTELIRRGHVGSTWRANLDAPELVRAIHADYVAAGAEVILTNTFLAGTEPVATAALRLARAVAGSAWVLGALGPTRGQGNMADFADPDAMWPVIEALRGADGLLFETCSDMSVFDVVRSVVQRLPNVLILVSFTYRQEPSGTSVTHAGDLPEMLAKRAEDTGVGALGVNCGLEQSPEACGEVLRRYRSATRLPLFARPNAGSPARVGSGWHYPLTPAVWAACVWASCDAAMVGGCCGSTPAHIAALLARRASEG